MAERISARLSRSTLRVVLQNVGLMAASLLFALLVAEGMVRAFYPVADGRSNVTLDGTPIRDWFPPNTVYRQVSNEYDAVTTITAKRHRVPGSDSPEVVFVGDSFTYGYGLSDDQTFASIYCRAKQVACANLGIPGSGTSRQVRRLAQFIDEYHWKPREVKFFFFGMSGSFSAGNDFADNYDYGRRQPSQSSTAIPLPAVARVSTRQPDVMETAAPSAAPRSLSARIINWQSGLLEHSHLMRRVKFHWGPLLKSLIVNKPANEQMTDALRYTKAGLQELDDLSRRVGFDYTIYLIVPVQDIIRGSFGDTLKTLDHVSPKPAVTTAALFVDSPQNFYYAYDGHLNPRGSRRVAELLIANDSRTAGN